MEADDNVIPFPGAFRGTVPEADQQGPEAIRSWLARVMDGGLDPAGVLAAVQGAVAPDFLAGGGWGFGGLSRERPTLLKRGRERACFVVRLDLDDAHPPIWRRLRLASDLTLSQLQPGGADFHARPAFRVCGKQLAQVRAADMRMMGQQRLPCRTTADGLHVISGPAAQMQPDLVATHEPGRERRVVA